MNEPRRTPAGPTRAAAAGLLAAAFLSLGGCGALEGALIGGWFGAILGQSAETAVAGAVVGAGMGAIIDSQDHGYWYQDYNCR